MSMNFNPNALPANTNTNANATTNANPTNQSQSNTQLEEICKSLMQDLRKVELERRKATTNVNKLQLLSKSQTAILRSNFSQKIKSRDALIGELFDALLALEEKIEKKGDGNDRLLHEKKSNGGDTKSSIDLPCILSTVDLLQKWEDVSRNRTGIQPDATEGDLDTLKLEVEELRRSKRILSNEFQKKVDHLQEEIAKLKLENTVYQVDIKKLEKEKRKSIRKSMSTMSSDLAISKELESDEVDNNNNDNTNSKSGISMNEDDESDTESQQISTEEENRNLRMKVMEMERRAEQDQQKIVELEKQYKDVLVSNSISLSKSDGDESRKMEATELQKKVTSLTASLSQSELTVYDLRQSLDDAYVTIKEQEETAAQIKQATEDTLNRVIEAKEVEMATLQESIDSLTDSLNEVNDAYGKLAAKESLNISIRNELQNVKIVLSSIKENLTKDLKHFFAKIFQETLSGMTKDIGSTLVSFFQSHNARQLELKQAYQRESRERKKWFNLVQELKGNIRVFCRVRPPTAKEEELDSSDNDSLGNICVKLPAPHALNQDEIGIMTEKGLEKNWEFDRVFGFNHNQEDVYAEVSPLVTSVLDGYNVCIFAYGQTGSGKTYTMTGPPDNYDENEKKQGKKQKQNSANTSDDNEEGIVFNSSRGVNIRALSELFTRCDQEENEKDFEISVSVMEIYNEQIHDLLNPDEKEEISQGINNKHTIRMGPNNQNYVTDLTIVPVRNLQEVKMLMELGDSNRSSASTNMNEHSSRSHLILSVYTTTRNKETNVITKGKLHLIDLAGSERISKSGARGQALKEAQNINKSLSALGNVISALLTKNKHIPYRNSTLTYLLQDSLGGDAKCLMFVCISPVFYNAEESVCSLEFAARARSVELGKATKHVETGIPKGMVEHDPNFYVSGAGNPNINSSGSSRSSRTAPNQQQFSSSRGFGR